MLALSIDIFHSAYIIFEYYKAFPHFMGIPYAFPFLYGPIFYIYSRLISKGDNHFDSKYYLHFIPFMLVVFYGLIFVYLKSAEFKIGLVKNDPGSLPPALHLIGSLKPVHGIIYVFLTLRVVSVYNEKIKDSYSNIERINLNWLRHLAVGLSIVWTIVVISYVVNIFSERDIQLDFLIYTAASILIYSIGYLSLRQPQIFDRFVQEPDADTVPEQKIKAEERLSYQKSGLSDAEAQKYLNELVQLMESDKPYLNSDLTLGELAGKVSMSTHNLSEILNTRLNQNFYDFINYYRVEEVKRRLSEKDSAKYSLLAIAFDSGFNSKSSFNTIFKKHTNITPSQYRGQFS